MSLPESEVFFHGTTQIFDCVRSIKSGMKLTLHLELEEQYEKFRDIPKTTKQITTIFDIWWRPAGSRVFKTTAVWYLGYTVTNTAGAKIKFELGEEEDFDLFMELQAGDEIEILLRQLMENEQAVDQVKMERVQRAHNMKGGPISKHAGRLCNDPDFQAMVHGRHNNFEASREGAAEFIRQWCGIESRAQLDHNPVAEQRYNIIKSSFLERQRAFSRH